MKLFIAIVLLATVAARSEGAPKIWDRITAPFKIGQEVIQGAKNIKFVKEAVQGAGDMVRSYSDMRKANWKNSDKYFHARGNHDAAKRGPGGQWAARVISNARERVDQWRGGSKKDSAADQAANRWGRNGGDPNRYRPKGLPSKY